MRCEEIWEIYLLKGACPRIDLIDHSAAGYGCKRRVDAGGKPDAQCGGGEKPSPPLEASA